MLVCPSCQQFSSSNFCSSCGTRNEPLPHCNWCFTELRPHENFCKECGKSRDEALTTSPPSQPDPLPQSTSTKKLFSVKNLILALAIGFFCGFCATISWSATHGEPLSNNVPLGVFAGIGSFALSFYLLEHWERS